MGLHQTVGSIYVLADQFERVEQWIERLEQDIECLLLQNAGAKNSPPVSLIQVEDVVENNEGENIGTRMRI